MNTLRNHLRLLLAVFACLALGVNARAFEWTLTTRSQTGGTNSPPDASCGSGGSGNASVTASGGGVSGNAMAADESNGCDITIVATQAGSLYEKWNYHGTTPPGGEVEINYTLNLSGEVVLESGDSAGHAAGFVEFTSNVGATSKSLAFDYGRSTESSTAFTMSAQYSGIGVSFDVTYDTNTGTYPVPAIPEWNAAAVECLNMYTRQHRTSGYVECWANGSNTPPIFFFLAVSKADLSGSVTSSDSKGDCPH